MIQLSSCAIVDINSIKFVKTCNRCKQTKPLDYFHDHCATADGKCNYCRKCYSKYNKNRYAKDTGRTVDQVGIRKSKIVNGKKFCSKCGVWKDITRFYKRLDDLSYECKLCVKINGTNNRRLHNNILKQEFVKAYGGCCSCCGETEFEFLTIEHVRYKEYELLDANGYSLLRKLKELKWPKEGYACLCFNCNLATSRNRICPHRRKVN